MRSTHRSRRYPRLRPRREELPLLGWTFMASMAGPLLLALLNLLFATFGAQLVFATASLIVTLSVYTAW